MISRWRGRKDWKPKWRFKIASRLGRSVSQVREFAISAYLEASRDWNAKALHRRAIVPTPVNGHSRSDRPLVGRMPQAINEVR